MTDWFTSDTHFGHVNILNYTNRGKIWNSVEEMNERLISRWNERVREGDTVYHLGDFAMGRKELWRGYRERLNGNIVFILGNHDSPLEKFMKVPKVNDIVCEQYLYVDQEGVRIWLAHVPIGLVDIRDGKKITRPINDVGDYDFSFCGHVHEDWLVDQNTGCINVGVDKWNYYPVTEDEIFVWTR